jgi:hypothetical protein
MFSVTAVFLLMASRRSANSDEYASVSVPYLDSINDFHLAAVVLEGEGEMSTYSFFSTTSFLFIHLPSGSGW